MAKKDNSENISQKFLDTQEPSTFAEDERLKLLSVELSFIVDPKIKSFVEFVLVKSDAFWIAPITPIPGLAIEDEYEEGGMVRSTIRTIKSFFTLESLYELSTQERDCVLAALLIRNTTRAMMDLDGDIHFEPFFTLMIDTYIEALLHSAVEDGDDLGSMLGIAHEDLAMIQRLVRVSSGYAAPIPEVFPSSPVEILVASASLIGMRCYDIYNLEDDRND